jgi:hypothetical protein
LKLTWSLRDDEMLNGTAQNIKSQDATCRFGRALELGYIGHLDLINGQDDVALCET